MDVKITYGDWTYSEAESEAQRKLTQIEQVEKRLKVYAKHELSETQILYHEALAMAKETQLEWKRRQFTARLQIAAISRRN